MNTLSVTTKSLTGSGADQSTDQTQGSIQIFLKWLDRMELQAIQENGSGSSQIKIVRRSTGFTNGPYVEIKESIGTLHPPRKY